MVTRRTFIRRFLALCGLGTISLSSCQSRSDAPLQIRRVKLGTLSEFSAPERILFLERVLVRRDALGLSAMSLTCTHQSCMVQKLSGEQNEFVCPCHGSRFNSDGARQKGPAERDLPWLLLELDHLQQIWATFGAPVTSDWRLPIPG